MSYIKLRHTIFPQRRSPYSLHLLQRGTPQKSIPDSTCASLVTVLGEVPNEARATETTKSEPHVHVLHPQTHPTLVPPVNCACAPGYRQYPDNVSSREQGEFQLTLHKNTLCDKPMHLGVLYVIPYAILLSISVSYL